MEYTSQFIEISQSFNDCIKKKSQDERMDTTECKTHL